MHTHFSYDCHDLELLEEVDYAGVVVNIDDDDKGQLRLVASFGTCFVIDSNDRVRNPKWPGDNTHERLQQEEEEEGGHDASSRLDRVVGVLSLSEHAAVPISPRSTPSDIGMATIMTSQSHATREK